MSVNTNVLKEIHRNHKEYTDVKLKTKETGLMRVCMYSKSALQ